MRRIILFIAMAGLISLPIWASGTPDNTASGGWLGVYTQTVDKDLKEAFRLETDHGVVVTNVVTDSPADAAGLKAGDIILSFDSDNLATAAQLADMVAKHESGDKVHLKILHKGNEKDVVATIGPRDESNPTKVFIGGMGHPGSITKSFVFDHSSLQDTYIGVNLESLGDQLGEYFGVKDGKGALVTEVIQDSPAEKAGLKAGDVIVSIDGKDVEGPSDVRKAVGDKERGDKITLNLMRERKETDVAVQVEETPKDLYSAPQSTPMPDVDNFSVPSVPPMKWLFKGDFDENMPDMKDMQENIKQLQEQMEQLQKELQNLQPGSGKKD